jgi:putative MATE family efflux protein
MTGGNIISQLVYFAVPLLLGNLFQQLYNAVDAIVVGNFVSKEALAAVGSTAPLINMIIAFAMGMFAGAGVMASRYFGARDRKSLLKAIHTTIALSAVMGVVLSVIGIVWLRPLLRFMGTPEEIMPDAYTYLVIYFGGLIALSIYNAGASILNALGNSRQPLFFLIVSCILNIFGDLMFVNVFHWGVAGVAVSTVIAEAVAMVLALMALHKGKGERLLNFKDLRVDFPILKQIVGIGLPSGIQGTIVSFSNTLVQSYFNGLGAISLAGYSAAQKIDAFAQLPVQTMAIAVATFVSQNLGAGQAKRARLGVRQSMLLGVPVTVLISTITLIFGRGLLRAFSPDDEVLEAGMRYIWVFAPFQFVLSGTQIIPGALRGAGSTRFPTFVCIFSFVALRQIYLFFITRINYSITTVAMGYPLTWMIAASAIFIFYLRSDWSKFERNETA